VEIELVPEPGNPHDRWAVALYVNGARIGYISSDAAGVWQDFVVTCNRRGIAVFARGDVRTLDGGRPAATVFLPWENELSELAMDDEVKAQCDHLLDALDPEDRDRMIAIGGWGIGAPYARILHGATRFAPDLNWKPNTKRHRWDSLPSQIVWRVSSINSEQRAVRAESRARARALIVEEREKLREARALAAEHRHRILQENVPLLYLNGSSKRAIASALQCSPAEVTRYLASTGTPSRSRPNSVSRDRRTARTLEAVRLQRRGLSRKKIAEELGCSLLTVKILLKDGKFYVDPLSDLPRLGLVQAAGGRQEGGERQEETAQRLGISTAKLKEVRRDFVVLQGLSLDDVGT
jgi:predicted transcriptional regulator